MAAKQQTTAAIFALALPLASWATGIPVTQTLLHVLETKGLSTIQAGAATKTAGQNYSPSALQSVSASLKSSPNMPNRYYKKGTLRTPVANGLAGVLKSAFTKHAPASRVKGAYSSYIKTVAKGGPPTTTAQLLISALNHGATTSHLKALVATYLQKLKSGSTAQGAMKKAQAARSRYGL